MFPPFGGLTMLNSTVLDNLDCIRLHLFVYMYYIIMHVATSGVLY